MNSVQHPEALLENAAGSSHEAGAAHRSLGRPSNWGLVVVVAVAAVAMRLAASRGDLVMDEIFSLMIAAKAESAGQIFVTHVDNNHILNTLALYALGPLAPFWAYRLPAVLAGSLALCFAFRLALRRGTVPAFCVLILLSFSHVLILFGTEARGYGYVACCTLAAWSALEGYLVRPRWQYACAFGVASSLGFLSHLTFLFAWLAFGVFSTMKVKWRYGTWQRLVVLNALPAMTCIGLSIAYVQGISIAGGNQSSIFDALRATLSLMAGGPERGNAANVAAIVMAALMAISLGAEFRLDRARGALYLTAIIVAPVAVLAVTGPTFLYPRYFLVPMIFGYVAVGFSLARWFLAGQVGRSLTAVLLAAFVALNLAPVVRLIREGRGQFSTTVRWMTDHAGAPVATVASDHDFRNALLVIFYANRNSLLVPPNGTRLEYVKETEVRQQGTDWYLRHRFDGETAPDDSFSDSFGNRYNVVKVFPAGSISGWTWWLYQRQRP